MQLAIKTYHSSTLLHRSSSYSPASGSVARRCDQLRVPVPVLACCQRLHSTTPWSCSFSVSWMQPAPVVLVVMGMQGVPGVPVFSDFWAVLVLPRPQILQPAQLLACSFFASRMQLAPVVVVMVMGVQGVQGVLVFNGFWVVLVPTCLHSFPPPPQT